MIFLLAICTAVAISALVYGLAGQGAQAQVAMDGRLRLAGGKGQPVTSAQTSAPALRGSRMAKSASLSRSLEGIHLLRSISGMLERSGWRLSVVEFLALSATSSIIVLMLALLKIPAFVVPAAAVGAFVPLFLLRRAVKKRRDLFVKQLVDGLTLMSNALKAGIGLMQAIDQVSEQMRPPISEEFRRLLRDIRLGATPDDAFAALNSRINSPDLDLVITAIIVQRSTGGNLAEILEQVSGTMRDRIQLRGEVKTLVSQQQMSGYLVGCMPLALLLAFNLMNHHYVAPLFTTTIGHVLLAVGGTLQFMGFVVIRKIVNIEV